MSDLVAISFDNEHTAFEMRAALAKMQKEYLIDMEDVVVVNKNDEGKVLKTSLMRNKGRRCANPQSGPESFIVTGWRRFDVILPQVFRRCSSHLNSP